jgi:hypothetical protein
MALFLRDELSMEEERRKALRLFGIDGTVFSYKYTSPRANLSEKYITSLFF